MNTTIARLSKIQISSRQLKLVSARSLNHLAEHGAQWDRVAAQSAQGLPMLSYAWTRSHLEHFTSAGEEWIVLFAYDEDMLVGVLTLILKKNIGYLGMTVARTITHANTTCGDMVALPERERECLDFFLDHIHQEVPGVIDVVFPAVTASSPAYLLSRGVQSGHKSFAREWGECGWLPCESGWVNYQTQLDKELKQDLRRMHKRLTDAGRVSVSVVTSDLAEPSHFQRFVRLEHSGWKGNRGTSICSSGLTLNFYRVLIDRLQELGWVEWHFMELDGKDIAAQLAVHTGKTLSLIKQAHNETYSRFTPDNLLFEQTLTRAFDSPDIDRVHCLAYGELFSKWNFRKQKFVEVHFISKGIAGTVFRRIPLSVRSFRRASRDSQPEVLERVE
jgi:Acetyltransferase (GNAT) domain